SNEAVVEQVAARATRNCWPARSSTPGPPCTPASPPSATAAAKGPSPRQGRTASPPAGPGGAAWSPSAMPPPTTRGHCHWLGLIADGHDAACRAAGCMLEEGADFLKVMATGGNMTPSSDPMTPQYDPPTLARIADIGRSAGRHTAAHVLSRSALPGV